MAAYAAYAVYAALAISAVSAIDQANTQEDIANENSRAINVQAGQEQDAATAEAERIRANGRRQAGEASAALSASGVSVADGSALLINQEIVKNSESDALNTIITGGRRSSYMDSQAMIEGKRGDAAKRAGYMDAASSALQMGATAATASGWRANGKPGFSGTQAPAPIYDRSIRVSQ